MATTPPTAKPRFLLPMLITMPDGTRRPLTPTEREARNKAHALYSKTPEQIQRIYGDSQKWSIWTTTFGGDLETARSHYRSGMEEWRSYNHSKAWSLAKCASFAALALIPKLMLTLWHTAYFWGKEASELRSRDICDLEDAAHFIVTGTLYSVAYAVRSIFTDLFLYVAYCRATPKDAIFMIDVQNDFLNPHGKFRGGTLPVTGGHEIIPVINEATQLFNKEGIVTGCADSHKADHRATSIMLNHGSDKGATKMLGRDVACTWPPHCIIGTRGQKYVFGLDVSRIKRIFLKGLNLNVDSFSAFWDNGRQFKTSAAEYLRAHGVKKIYFVGLAYDFCVGFSALDAVDEGFEAVVIEDATKSVKVPVTLPDGTKTDTAELMRQKLLAKKVTLTTLAKLKATDPNFGGTVSPQA